MKTKTKYIVCGAVLMIPQTETAKYGYETTLDYPVLVYSKEGENLEHNLFYKETDFDINDNYKFLPEHLIQKRYTIEEAQKEFPELFL